MRLTFRAVANLAAVTFERGRAQAVALEAETARQNQELKSMPLDALAHDFKTPLTSIKASVSSLLERGDSPHAELLAARTGGWRQTRHLRPDSEEAGNARGAKGTGHPHRDRKGQPATGGTRWS